MSEAKSSRSVGVERGPRCDVCGTRTERVLDAFTDEPKGWKCPEVFLTEEGWEHG